MAKRIYFVTEKREDKGNIIPTNRLIRATTATVAENHVVKPQIDAIKKNVTSRVATTEDMAELLMTDIKVEDA